MDRLRLEVRQRLFVAGGPRTVLAVEAAETTRLASVDAELSALLRSASGAQRRAAAAAIAVLVVPVTRLSGKDVEAGLEAVRERLADPDLSVSLASLSSSLDEEALLLQERSEHGMAGSTEDEPGDYFRSLVGDETGEAPSLEVAFAVMFTRARAAAALSWALSEDTDQAAQEAVYEASAAIGNLAALRHLIEHAMAVPS